MDKSKAQGIGCLVLLGGLAAAWLYSLTQPAQPKFEVMAQPGHFAMIIPEGADPAALPAAAKERCGSAGFCKVLGWTDEAKAAKALPMLDDEVKALAFAYTHNRSSGFEQALWDCKRFPQADKAKCLELYCGDIGSSHGQRAVVACDHEPDLRLPRRGRR